MLGKAFSRNPEGFSLCDSSAGSLQGVGLSSVGSVLTPGHSSTSRDGFGPKMLPVPHRMSRMGQRVGIVQPGGQKTWGDLMGAFQDLKEPKDGER